MKGNSQGNGAFIEQRRCSGDASQSWGLQAMGGGYYQFVAQSSGKCMTVQDAGQNEGALIVQWACAGADHQLWRLRQVGSYYQIVAKHSGQCVDEDAFRSEEGLEMQQWPCGSSDIDNQLWSLGSSYAH
ncbi:MAG: RICIN domain-containing protein [Chloroflexota bacterium]|nr:RICIN domain-containing protein [Chloroflexota bacterium]